MIKSLKVRLKPNNKQQSKLFAAAGTARFAYNWALGRQIENYKTGGKFLSDYNLRKEFTQLKKKPEYAWLNDYSNNITKQAIKDACAAYIMFFKKQSKYPKFKSRKKTKPSFYVDTDKIQFSSTHIKLEKLTTSRKQNRQKLNWIRLCEKDRIPQDAKYINPRVSFDGLHWWVSVGIEYPNNSEIPTNEGLGIDLGINKTAVLSDGTIYKNINKTKQVKKLDKRKKRLQRQVARKYENNKAKTKGGENRYCKTNNIKKLEKKLLKLNHRLTNTRQNYSHQTTTEIIKRKPSYIVVEDLHVSGMMRNKHLSKAIQQQSFFEFKRQLEYKSNWNKIEFIKADRFYPSSKICSECGAYKKDLKLSDRTYVCKECGCKKDRDLNASINLKNYQDAV